MTGNDGGGRGKESSTDSRNTGEFIEPIKHYVALLKISCGPLAQRGEKSEYARHPLPRKVIDAAFRSDAGEHWKQSHRKLCTTCRHTPTISRSMTNYYLLDVLIITVYRTASTNSGWRKYHSFPPIFSIRWQYPFLCTKVNTMNCAIIIMIIMIIIGDRNIRRSGKYRHVKCFCTFAIKNDIWGHI